ncbi:N-acetylmuramoyl-L-alanine amidase [Ichthyenterobacterium sp. W332]|uniref:N-acetylmuramoyl-L-alanine amidase n=1 Tax=Microcosmobacter mediterraneus TaxID=3075607 RepID=A0ABU2YNB8_9FLAO|nr:N-acetylmuramoyl-L-alanine amidase [Ichthyenterobacterium sp. W332]MDT0559169.1 N-acetylmuramoyl-L-alanine amidase [Ichthyenterobacterium sp. W332]
MKTSLLHTFVFILFTFIGSLTSQLNAQNGSDTFTVVIDAGHGGKDPGRPTKHGYKEKHIALKIALAVGKTLEQYNNINVIYTRKTDVFLELHERAAIANKADADLFVSIHCNAHNSQAYGTETYVLATRGDNKNIDIAKKENEVIFLEDDYEQRYEGFDPSSPESLLALSIIAEEYLEQSIILARLVEDNFKGKLERKSRGVKDAAFWVLHNTYMPSVLIETGFITNNKEGAYLNSKRGQIQISTQISNAIIDYKKKLDKNVGTHLVLDNKPKQDNTISSDISESAFYDGITFKVQIAAGQRRLATKAYNFKGLSGISREKSSSIYKYFYGETSDYNKALQLKENAKAKGYTSCFIVAYKGGERVDVNSILKTASN